jgi:hypothetical protein
VLAFQANMLLWLSHSASLTAQRFQSFHICFTYKKLILCTVYRYLLHKLSDQQFQQHKLVITLKELGENGKEKEKTNSRREKGKKL